MSVKSKKNFCYCCGNCSGGQQRSDYQKIVDLKDLGLTLYRYVIHPRSFRSISNVGSAKTTVDANDIYILHKTKNNDISPTDYALALDRTQIPCLRCRDLARRAQILLQHGKTIGKNIIEGICEHCLNHQDQLKLHKSCSECQKIVKKFAADVAIDSAFHTAFESPVKKIMQAKTKTETQRSSELLSLQRDYKIGEMFQPKIAKSDDRRWSKAGEYDTIKGKKSSALEVNEGIGEGPKKFLDEMKVRFGELPEIFEKKELSLPEIIANMDDNDVIALFNNIKNAFKEQKDEPVTQIPPETDEELEKNILQTIMSAKPHSEIEHHILQLIEAEEIANSHILDMKKRLKEHHIEAKHKQPKTETIKKSYGSVENLVLEKIRQEKALVKKEAQYAASLIRKQMDSQRLKRPQISESGEIQRTSKDIRSEYDNIRLAPLIRKKLQKTKEDFESKEDSPPLPHELFQQQPKPAKESDFTAPSKDIKSEYDNMRLASLIRRKLQKPKEDFESKEDSPPLPHELFQKQPKPAKESDFTAPSKDIKSEYDNMRLASLIRKKLQKPKEDFESKEDLPPISHKFFQQQPKPAKESDLTAPSKDIKSEYDNMRLASLIRKKLQETKEDFESKEDSPPLPHELFQKQPKPAKESDFTAPSKDIKSEYDNMRLASLIRKKLQKPKEDFESKEDLPPISHKLFQQQPKSAKDSDFTAPTSYGKELGLDSIRTAPILKGAKTTKKPILSADAETFRKVHPRHAKSQFSYEFFKESPISLKARVASSSEIIKDIKDREKEKRKRVLGGKDKLLSKNEQSDKLNMEKNTAAQKETDKPEIAQIKGVDSKKDITEAYKPKKLSKNEQSDRINMEKITAAQEEKDKPEKQEIAEIKGVDSKKDITVAYKPKAAKIKGVDSKKDITVAYKPKTAKIKDVDSKKDITVAYKPKTAKIKGVDSKKDITVAYKPKTAKIKGVDSKKDITVTLKPTTQKPKSTKITAIEPKSDMTATIKSSSHKPKLFKIKNYETISEKALGRKPKIIHSLKSKEKMARTKKSSKPAKIKETGRTISELQKFKDVISPKNILQPKTVSKKKKTMMTDKPDEDLPKIRQEFDKKGPKNIETDKETETETERQRDQELEQAKQRQKDQELEEAKQLEKAKKITQISEKLKNQLNKRLEAKRLQKDKDITQEVKKPSTEENEKGVSDLLVKNLNKMLLKRDKDEKKALKMREKLHKKEHKLRKVAEKKSTKRLDAVLNLPKIPSSYNIRRPIIASPSMIIREKTGEQYVKLPFKSIRLKGPSIDNLILRLVKIRQNKSKYNQKAREDRTKDLIEAVLARRLQKRKLDKDGQSESDLDSDYLLDLESLMADTIEENGDIIIGNEILNPEEQSIYFNKREIQVEPQPSIFKSTYEEPFLEQTVLVTEDLPKASEQRPQKKSAHPLTKSSVIDQGPGPEVIRYRLSDKTFVDKGWTQLPTQKIYRKMNVYRMNPAHPEFDWFKHNGSKGYLLYDTGELLAVFDDKGHGRWYYRNGNIALEFYDAEELNARKRTVIYSTGEPCRGRSQPVTVLGSFDYCGNGVVLDHQGNIRLKYNQDEGVVLDKQIGPLSHWKWHSLNEPPMFEQVWVETKEKFKDPAILKLVDLHEDRHKSEEEIDMERTAIEFDNSVKEKLKAMKDGQRFRPFPIRMKAVKINEQFSLRVLDQANIYILFKDGSTNLKLNVGMNLDPHEIVDLEYLEIEPRFQSHLEMYPALSDSICKLQSKVDNAKEVDHAYKCHENWLNRKLPSNPTDKLFAVLSRPIKSAAPDLCYKTVSRCDCN